MGVSVQENATAFSFSSKVFGRFLERLCGSDAATKQLPELYSGPETTPARYDDGR